jgi:hypothetical protein
MIRVRSRNSKNAFQLNFSVTQHTPTQTVSEHNAAEKGVAGEKK